MSREQRRVDRKSQGRTATTTRRTTPVKAGGGGPPWLPIGVAAGVLVVVALIAYLIIAAHSSGPNVNAAQAAADNSSSSIPGTYVAEAPPPDNRAHFPFSYTGPDSFELPFCPGVVWSGAPNGQPSTTPAAGASTPTPLPTANAEASSVAGHGAGVATVSPGDCYSSNPPSSGKHYNVQGNIDLGNGTQINIPADISVYPPDVEIPRSSIPHILEHAGVYVGWNCAKGDQACLDVEKKLEDVVNDRIDINHNRVVMAHDNDLVPGTIGLSSWTRVYTFSYKDYNKGKVTDFIGTNSCRVDWEGFC